MEYARYIPKPLLTHPPNNQPLVPFFLGGGLAIDPQKNSWSPTRIRFRHCILSEVILFVTSLIDMSFFTSTNVIFGLPLPFFCSLNLNQLTISYGCINPSPYT